MRLSSTFMKLTPKPGKRWLSMGGSMAPYPFRSHLRGKPRRSMGGRSKARPRS